MPHSFPSVQPFLITDNYESDPDALSWHWLLAVMTVCQDFVEVCLF